jgi:hypothetical protein
MPHTHTDGLITFEEFAAGFDMFDTDSDGTLARNEIETVRGAGYLCTHIPSAPRACVCVCVCVWRSLECLFTSYIYG